jgi:Holliday junction DNA helicase RuvB
MENNTDYFTGIVGQERAKRKLTLYLDGFKKSRMLPNLLFEGANGVGKSILAKKTANATEKVWAEVSGGGIRNVNTFVDNTLIPMQDKDCLLFIDEIHAIPKAVSDLLLMLLNPTADNKNIVRVGDMELSFDMRRVSFMCATTERQKIFKPLLSRLTPISLANYDEVELALIIQTMCKISDDAALELATYTRGTGRSAHLMGKEVLNYCLAYDLDVFPEGEIKNLMEILDIFPLGLTEQEVNVLAHIRDSKGGITLSALSSKTSLTRQAQQDMESYLQKHGLMHIEGIRKITQKGMAYLKEINR